MPSDARSDLVVVRDESGLEGMVSELLSDERVWPVVGVVSAIGGAPVVSLGGVYAAVGGGRARVYLLENESLLRELRKRLGSKLALRPDSLRVWWPELTRRSDPEDHPLVLVLEGQSEPEILAELTQQFDLSRPHVRREIKIIEDARRLAEHRREDAESQSETNAERVRDAHKERHRAVIVAEQAETARETAGSRTEVRLIGLGPDEPETDSTLRMFGARLKALRAAAGLSQRDLEWRCFLPDGHVSRFERGVSVPNLLVLGVLAHSLAVSVGDLTDGLAPTFRNATTRRILEMAAREPRPDTSAIVESLGLPAPYVRRTISYLQSVGELQDGKDGWEPATQHGKTT